jgi:hypothetical protein
MLTTRRALVLGLFAACLAASSHTPTLAQGGEKKHPVIHKALKDMHDAHKRLKALKPIFGGHREKAMKHIHEASEQLREAIKYVDKQ